MHSLVAGCGPSPSERVSKKEREIILHILVKGKLRILIFWWGAVKDYLSRTALISIFGQRTEGLSSSLYWRCRERGLWYNSWEEAERRQKTALCL